MHNSQAEDSKKLCDSVEKCLEEFLLRVLFLKSCEIVDEALIKELKGKSLVKEFNRKIEEKLNDILLRVKGGIFGSGSYHDCNFLAFLGEGQEVKNGFYPVLLFYRRLKDPILIVAYGISESNIPTNDWRLCKELQISSLPSIDNFFNDLLREESVNGKELSRYKNKSRVRYGNSIFYAAYKFKLSKGISKEELKKLIDNNKKEELKKFLFERFSVSERYYVDLKEKKIKKGKKGGGIKILLKELSEDLNKLIQDYESCLNILNILNILSTKNIIYFGPPGTGKTYKAREKAKVISNMRSKNVKFVTFHPSFAYENFIEGIWPEIEDGQISYTIRDGILKELSIEAMWNALKSEEENVGKKEADYKTKKEKVITALKKIQSGEANVRDLFNFGGAENFVLIIDEINRGNIPSIFGELISLIEENKRLGESETLITTLPYSREPFAVPKNLYIIGTMNTTDRSVVIMDAALRRRFHFEEIAPNPDLLDGIVIKKIDVKKLLQKINEEITKIPYLGRDYQIGHSYFLELEESRSLRKLVEILRKKVLPLLQEYFYGRWEDLEKVLGSNWKKFIDETGRITLEENNNENIVNLIKSIYEESGGQDNTSNT